MAIGDLFRPKYKHSDPTVRAEAVRALGDDDLEVLLEIAGGDRDLSVRRQAIEKIADADVLARLAESQEDARLGKLARERATALRVAEAVGADDDEREALARVASVDEASGLAEIAASAKLKVVRSAALDRLDDDRALAQVVRGAAGADEWAAALERIGDIEVLRGIAMDEQRKDVACAAVDRIEDPEILEALVARAKNKSVRTRAKNKRATIEQTESMTSAAPTPEKRDHAERVQVVRLIEKRAMGGEWVESHREVMRAVMRWDELGPGDDGELGERYAKAKKRYFDNYARYKVRGPAAPSKKPAAAEPASTETAATADAAPTDASAVPTELASGGTTAVYGAEPVASASPTDKAPPSRAAGRPRPAPAPVTDEQREANKKSFEELCERVEKLGQSDKLKGYEKSLKKADGQRREVGPLPSGSSDLERRYAEAHAQALIRLGELREAEEWKRWANIPVLEKLIAEAEALLARADDEAKLGNKLKSLQDQWKNAGPAPREKSQELWDRFKAHTDAVYDRVKAQRAAISEVQKENLRRKEELCVRAESLAESTDWDVTADAFKQLQAEWKQIGPVPRRRADQIWKRFRSACDLFFERRRPHLESRLGELSDNLAAKVSIVEELEAMAADEAIEPEEAMNRAKRLQREWRDIGPVPRREFGKLGDRYKAAGDAVFRKRDQLRERERAAREEAVRAAGATIEATAAKVAAGTLEGAELSAEVLAARAAFLEVSSERGAGALADKLDELSRAAVEAQPDAFRGTELDPEASRKRKEKLASRIEELAPQKAPEPAELSAEAMAEKLRAALADRALGGVLSKTGGRPIRDIVAEARQSWSRLGPVPGSAGSELERRFQEACERALGQ